jgi:hypothetical protein
VQTFLPVPDFDESACLLDWRRLGKQRVEADQILRALEDPNYGWQNHPAVRQWRGFSAALRRYRNAMIREWVRRGYRNTMPLSASGGSPRMPPWLGHRGYHLSHRSNLLRKEPAWYAQHGWRIRSDRPYLWPYVVEGELHIETGAPPTFFV